MEDGDIHRGRGRSGPECLSDIESVSEQQAA